MEVAPALAATRPVARPAGRGRLVVWSGYALILLVAPLVLPSNLDRSVLMQIGIGIVACLSYNMLLGQTGLLSFGHAVYYGLGGFVAIHAMNTIIRNKYAIPLPVIPLVGGAAGLFFGIVFGSVSTRRAGTVFSMISLGLGELVASPDRALDAAPIFFDRALKLTDREIAVCVVKNFVELAHPRLARADFHRDRNRLARFASPLQQPFVKRD